MKYTIDREEKYAAITLHEEKLDSKIAPNLKSEFTVLNAEGMKNIILDLHDTQYVDSSGLSAILVANRLCKNAGGVLVLSSLNEQVSKIIDISHLNDTLNILPTKEEAMEAIFLNELEEDLQKEVDPEFVEDEIEGEDDWDDEDLDEEEDDEFAEEFVEAQDDEDK